MKKDLFTKKGLLPLAIMMMSCSLGVTSCDNDDDFISSESKKAELYELKAGILPETNEKENASDSTGTLKFTYQGQIYTSPCKYTDTTLVIKNAFVRSVYKTLKSKKNVAIYVNDDMTLDFYDSEQDMREIRHKNILRTRANTLVAHYIKNFQIRVYEHAKGRKKGGRYLHFFSNGTQGNKSPAPLYIPQSYLARYTFDKTISSSETWAEIGEQGSVSPLLPGTLLEGQYTHVTTTFYENGDYTGRSLTLTEMSINYTHSHVDYFSSMGFNDLTSSFKVVYDNIM